MPGSVSLACAPGAMSHPFLGVQKMMKQENHKAIRSYQELGNSC